MDASSLSATGGWASGSDRQDEREKFLASFVMFDWQGLADRDRRHESFLEKGRTLMEFLQNMENTRVTPRQFESRKYGKPRDLDIFYLQNKTKLLQGGAPQVSGIISFSRSPVWLKYYSNFAGYYIISIHIQEN